MRTSLLTAWVFRGYVLAMLFAIGESENPTKTRTSKPLPSETTNPFSFCAFGNLTLDQLKSSPAFDPAPHNYSTAPITDIDRNISYNLTYWVNRYGNVIHSGDIIWGTQDQLHRVHGGQSSKRGYGVVGNEKSRWPGGIIKYRYSTQAIRDAHKDGFDSAINDWRSWAPYLQFVEYPINDALEADIVTITEDGSGCYATVGYYNDHKQLNIQKWDVRSPLYPYACYRHEFGHILGLLHEHQRPDRDKYIRYNCDAVKAVAPPGETCTEEEMDCCAHADSKCCASQVSQLDKSPEDPLVQTYGEYDINSIMHYSGSAGAIQDDVFHFRFTLEPLWVPKVFPDLYNWFVGQVFRGLYSINQNYWIKASDAAAVCSIYVDLCKAYFPEGLPGKPVEPPRQTATSAAPVTPPSNPHRRAWIFRARTPLSGIDQGGELAYAQNPVALYARKASYLVADDAGKTTVNTGCVKVVDTSQPANTVGVSNSAVVDRLLKGYSFYFGYTSDELLNDEASDSCCLTLYTDDECSAGSAMGGQGGCGIMATDFSEDVLSWKVDGCKMLYSEI